MKKSDTKPIPEQFKKSTPVRFKELWAQMSKTPPPELTQGKTSADRDAKKGQPKPKPRATRRDEDKWRAARNAWLDSQDIEQVHEQMLKDMQKLSLEPFTFEQFEVALKSDVRRKKTAVPPLATTPELIAQLRQALKADYLEWLRNSAAAGRPRRTRQYSDLDRIILAIYQQGFQDGMRSRDRELKAEHASKSKPSDTRDEACDWLTQEYEWSQKGPLTLKGGKQHHAVFQVKERLMQQFKKDEKTVERYLAYWRNFDRPLDMYLTDSSQNSTEPSRQ